MEKHIYKRYIIDRITPYLSTKDVVVIHGARQVGKTHILRYLNTQLMQEKKQTYYMDLEDSRYVSLLNQGHEALIKHLEAKGFYGENTSEKIYLFIDEIQYLSRPSSLLKLLADHYNAQIKLIVSGSSSFDIKTKFTDSLVGRTVNFEIFPLSFQEFLLFKNYSIDLAKVSTPLLREELKQLFQEYVLYGGYPKIVLTKELERKEMYLQQIIDTYIKKDIRDLADIRDINAFNKLLEILASQSGQLLNISELANTCKIAKQTVKEYLFLMEQTYIIKLVRPYYHNIRAELSKTPKVYLYDTGLQHLLWLKALPKTILGSAFETALFSELVKKYGMNAVYYWRTTDKKEIDFIVRDKNKLLPIEAKLNFANFKPTAMQYFCKQYHVDAYTVVSMDGEPIQKYGAYPWEL